VTSAPECAPVKTPCSGSAAPALAATPRANDWTVREGAIRGGHPGVSRLVAAWTGLGFRARLTYINRMAKGPADEKLPWWSDSRIKGTPATHVGNMRARDAEAAIAAAIKEFGITEKHQQDRLVARPLKRSR
jgi:hypothetical protein